MVLKFSLDVVAPRDVLATMWHQLGVSPSTEIHDRLDRPFPLSSGSVLHDIL